MTESLYAVWYSLPSTARYPCEQRPGFIVTQWSDDIANLVVFVDGSNDGYANPVLWVTSAVKANIEQNGHINPGEWVYRHD